MTTEDITFVASDDRITRRERQRQSDYREQVLGLPAGRRGDRVLGNYLPPEEWRSNFLSREAADYAERRAGEVQREGGQLETTRLFTNMLSSMPLAFSVFGHLSAHRTAAVRLLKDLRDLDVAELVPVRVGSREIDGIECEWAPDRRDHLNDRTAFDAVVSARLADGRSLLVAVETKYVDSFSRDPRRGRTDAKYRARCADFGMAEGAYDRLREHATRQLLRNVLLTESVRRGGSTGRPVFDEAVTVVLARDDDTSARAAVEAVAADRGAMPTDVRFIGHGQLVTAAERDVDLADWAGRFRQRYVGG
ncbi:PGN_0703 family putative restriction endonuclease [Geodermatophilus sp. URMC 61]|uniref:PGN_0703 family putative restriction endonuclease n=1 Tax=Geodermatophilus sp. URMC 61 TaxID=3423411 RepID=UPI00406D16ED